MSDVAPPPSSEFPTYVFKAGETPRVVDSLEALLALGPGWTDTPFLSPEEQARQRLMAETQKLLVVQAPPPLVGPVFEEFPAYVFKHGVPPQVVSSIEDFVTLGAGWADTPELAETLWQEAQAAEQPAAPSADVALLVDEPVATDDAPRRRRAGRDAS